ncbi:hypothetical protein EDB19DRAFT_1768304 [Suillus lakei]|nr:hypothetical protein EDB19DRAFT_1768304 [Suillus lakei]
MILRPRASQFVMASWTRPFFIPISCIFPIYSLHLSLASIMMIFHVVVFLFPCYHYPAFDTAAMEYLQFVLLYCFAMIS